MALDPTARQANIKDSLKKYFVDNLETIEGLKVTFDKALSEPDLQDKSVDRWVTIALGSLLVATLSDITVTIYVCTRKDNEGYKLAQLRDKVMGYLSVDSDDESGDSTKRIPFYRSYANQAWEVIGGFVVREVLESGELEAPEETKYQVLTVQLATASKV